VTHLIVINMLQKLGHFWHIGQKRLLTYTNELCAVVPCVVGLVKVQCPQEVNDSTPTSEIIIMQLNDLPKVLPYKRYYFWSQKKYVRKQPDVTSFWQRCSGTAALIHLSARARIASGRTLILSLWRIYEGKKIPTAKKSVVSCNRQIWRRCVVRSVFWWRFDNALRFFESWEEKRTCFFLRWSAQHEKTIMTLK